MEFVLGLQQAEEDLDWVGFFMIMVMVMVMVMLILILMVILMVMVRRTWTGWVAIFSLILFFMRNLMVMVMEGYSSILYLRVKSIASIVKNCFM